ncbi:MAG: BolA/IbaG family iron-sulfur metabolism protein [Planctomycetes bacterium]|nr:BolA/IbaG family iron-sulfur metabolism protein [Planctomycetota bacterium]
MNEMIADLIRQSLPDATVHVVSPDGVHFQALVISAAFEGQPLVRQHQTVMAALKDDFDSERVHALALKTFTPEKWRQNQHLYAQLTREESKNG